MEQGLYPWNAPWIYVKRVALPRRKTDWPFPVDAEVLRVYHFYVELTCFYEKLTFSRYDVKTIETLMHGDNHDNAHSSNP